jgi:hypothetical protein
MKEVIIFFLSLGVVVFMGCNMSQHESENIPMSEQAVNSLMGKIARSFKQKYNMRACGLAVAMPRGVVKELGLDFRIYGPLSRDEIRKVLVRSVQEFLLLVNSDEAVKPYLENYPFTFKNVDISLFLNGFNGNGLDDPHIGIAGISKGKLDYEILITTDIPTTKSRFVETYEEALKALENP